MPASYQIDGWTIAHGHRPIVGERTVSGHFHPVLRAEGLAAPCFLAGPDRIVLPAFSANAAGCDVLSGPIPADWLEGSLRCIASTGSELLDFGPLRALRRQVGFRPDTAADPVDPSQPESLPTGAWVGPVHRPSGPLEAIVR